MLARKLTSDAASVPPYKVESRIEYQELKLPVRRPTEGMGVVINAENIIIELLPGGQAEADASFHSKYSHTGKALWGEEERCPCVSIALRHACEGARQGRDGAGGWRRT